MSDISIDIRRPSLQKRVFTFSKSSPSELVRSKLSVTEISHRALTYLPDELLRDIPENDSSYSLFDGFQASVDHSGKRDNKHGGGKNLLAAADADKTAMGQLKREREGMNKQLDTLGIRKSIASSEIREIDSKIAQLTAIRGAVLERLARLEQDESQVEHERMIKSIPKFFPQDGCKRLMLITV